MNRTDKKIYTFLILYLYVYYVYVCMCHTHTHTIFNGIILFFVPISLEFVYKKLYNYKQIICAFNEQNIKILNLIYLTN